MDFIYMLICKLFQRRKAIELISRAFPLQSCLGKSYSTRLFRHLLWFNILEVINQITN